MGDPAIVDFEEIGQVRARVAAAMAVGAEHGVAPAMRNEHADLIGDRPHVVVAPPPYRRARRVMEDNGNADSSAQPADCLRQPPGETPNWRLNARLNAASDSYPTANETCATLPRPSRKRSAAMCMRQSVRYCIGG